MSHLSHPLSKPSYYIEDCWILKGARKLNWTIQKFLNLCLSDSFTQGLLCLMKLNSLVVIFAENISVLEATVHSALIYGVTYTIPTKNYNLIPKVTLKKKGFFIHAQHPR